MARSSLPSSSQVLLLVVSLVALGCGDDFGIGDRDAGDASFLPDGVSADAAVDGETPDVPEPVSCSGSAWRCGATGSVEECQSEVFMPITECPLGCMEGACTDEVACTPGARRCRADIAEICNASGSAYFFSDECGVSECSVGLCTGACDSGAVRCNGLVAEACSEDGAAFAMAETCEVACVRGVCALERLDVTENMTLEGEVIVNGPVNVFAGARRFSETGNLTIRAQRITVDEGGSIVVAATGDDPRGRGSDRRSCLSQTHAANGGSYGTAGGRGYRDFGCDTPDPFAWGSDVDSEVSSGSRGGTNIERVGTAGGGVVRLIAREIRVAGTVSADGDDGPDDGDIRGYGSGGGILFAGGSVDLLGVVTADGGTRYNSDSSGGQGRIKVLYASSLEQTGTVGERASSGMLPPLDIGSSSHPNPERYYNDDFENVVLSWERPFDVQGYYIAVNSLESSVPTPADASLVTREAVAIDAANFVPGDNWFHLAPVNAMSEVGTIESTFRVRINSEAPALTSASHPDSEEWSTNADVVMA